MNFNIFLTDNAKQHFLKLLKDKSSIFLSVKKSGCSGFSYEIKVKENQSEFIQNFDGIDFIIPEDSKPALNNLVIDFKKEGLSQKIVFDNPNVDNACGCGESFTFKGV